MVKYHVFFSVLTFYWCSAVFAGNSVIGVFDSGIGGMTVLEKMLTMDMYDNVTHERKSDGKLDFENERFVYLGDQANMPYGDYAAAGKSEYLKRLIVADADFLLSQNAKVVVIACNTATAWGYDKVSQKTSEKGVSTIGVIGAGVSSALDLPEIKNANGDISIGVMATPGTIASGAYEREILKEAARRGIKGKIKVFSQGCAGLADAVESGDYKAGEIAASNYKALMEKYSSDKSAGPMKAVILGCTHYPFVLTSLKREAGEMIFVDPALATAEQCYRNLISKDNISKGGEMALTCYVSVPAKNLDNKYLDNKGNLTRECKYGRDLEDSTVWTQIVPYGVEQAKGNSFIRTSLSAVWNLLNLRTSIPE
jgi:glutamate racemase